MPEKDKKRIWEADRAYSQYLKNHHPEAVEFIKQNAEAIKNKSNIWLDIKKYSVFPGKAPDGSKLPGAKKVILFQKIVFDIFPRRIKPQYIEGNTPYNRYITWKTATDDIRKQRSGGYKGVRWFVECQLEVHKTKNRTKKELVPATRILIDNPAYLSYLKTQEYQNYKSEYSAYKSRLLEYNNYRRSFQEFRLPDGSIKQVLLYVRAEEKYAMLRSLGVSESEIQKSRERLTKPLEPVPPPAPQREITKMIPAYYKERTIPGKWVWHHSVKFVRRCDLV
ncbi:MAG: hypothetical protein Q4A32_02520 [Lachnospiraceae bacterium]|nr:hypothetical protein [Lachnospiraceae bacterium]